MITEATKDTSTRTASIAKNTNTDLGNIKKPDLGIFQITSQNSLADFSYDGSFNIQSKNKSAHSTVRLAFRVN
jgi:hypothetical protein